MNDLPASDLLALDRRHVWHPFTQAQTAPSPLLIERGDGAYLHTSDGRALLDLISSWWVNLHGHAHPHIAAAIAEQAAKLEHVIFAGMTHAGAVQLSARLTQHLPGGLQRVFFTDNGSSSVEVALKLAQQAWLNRGEPRTRILAFDGGYHGDTFGAMSAGRSSGFYEPFQDKLFHVDFLPFPATWAGDEEVDRKEHASLAVLDAYLAQHGPDTAAFIAEPLVQGSSGMRMCRPEFLSAVVERVRASGALVIFDEIMTGFYRTGRLWAMSHLNVTPDIVCLSKGLTGGFLPMALTICTEGVFEAFLGETFDRAFAHGHSYTANPLGCAAALASLDLTEHPDTRARVHAITRFHEEHQRLWQDHPMLERARVTGTIAAVDFVNESGYGGQFSLALRSFFLDRGLLLRPLGNTVYLLPPYCVETPHLERAYAAILEAADAHARGHFG